jgi:hypothetical protein
MYSSKDFMRYDPNFATTIGRKLKGTAPRDFRLQVFFHVSVSPKPLNLLLRLFQIFSKICGDIHSARLTNSKWKKLQSESFKFWVVELTYRQILFLQVHFKVSAV